MSSFNKRLLTSIFIVLMLIFMYWLGNEAISLFMAFLTVLAVYELKKAFKNIDINIYFIPIELVLILSILISFTSLEKNIYFNAIKSHNVLIISLICFIIYIFDLSDKRVENLGASMISVLYIYGLGRVFYSLSSYNYLAYIFIIAVTSGTDVFAYLGGSLLGKHKLMPKISPKKTVEGAIFGILGAVICGILAVHFFMAGIVKINFILILTLILLGIFAEFGDLFASAIKRATKIKDFSNILPGHGGILDRMDSLLFVASIVGILCQFVF